MGVSIWLRRSAWATLIGNAVLVVTGGAVRLTGSGLGCPTWPRCTGGSFTPHGAMGIHSAIEFGNRTLTFVLTAIAIATLVTAWRSGRRDLRRLAVLLALSIPAQAVLGGITVLTDLNPWVVSLHLLLSLAIIAVAVLLVWRLDRPAALAVRVPAGAATRLALAAYAVSWVVFYVGTVVTGSGPHAGDAHSPRNGLDPLELSQLHADLVFLLIGLSLALVLVERRRSTVALVGVELAQGVIGYVQYATDLPAAVVVAHLFGAAALAAVGTWMLLDVREDRVPLVGERRPADPARLHARSPLTRRNFTPEAR